MNIEKIEEWKNILNKIQLLEQLLQQNINIYINRQTENYKEFLEYALNNIKELQEEHKKSDLVYQQAFSYRDNKRQKREN